MKNAKDIFNHVAKIAKEEASWSLRTFAFPLTVVAKAFVSILPR